MPITCITLRALLLCCLRGMSLPWVTDQSLHWNGTHKRSITGDEGSDLERECRVCLLSLVSFIERPHVPQTLRGKCRLRGSRSVLRALMSLPWTNQSLHRDGSHKQLTARHKVNTVFYKNDRFLSRNGFLKDFLCKLFFENNCWKFSRKICIGTFSGKLNFSKCNYFQRDSFGRLLGDPEISSNPQFFGEIFNITRGILFFLFFG